VKRGRTDIGTFILTERRTLGWTQEQTALYAGVSAKLVADIEHGKPSLQMDAVNRVLGLFGKRLGPVDDLPGTERPGGSA
jgi:transcriptional regulator with XRE-family HTH domain